MASRVSASSPRGTRAGKSVKRTSKSKGVPNLTGGRVQPWAKDRLPTKADLRDSPEAVEGAIPVPLTDYMLRTLGTRNPALRPNKTQITMRLDQDVFAWLRAKGKGYQTRLNAMLRQIMIADQNHGRGRS